MMEFHLSGSTIIYMIILWVAIIIFAIWLLSLLFPHTGSDSSTQSSTGRSGSSESALEILQQRFDRGELSKTEYEEMRRDLQG
jgi:putative membrane protein